MEALRGRPRAPREASRKRAEGAFVEERRSGPVKPGSFDEGTVDLAFCYPPSGRPEGRRAGQRASEVVVQTVARAEKASARGAPRRALWAFRTDGTWPPSMSNDVEDHRAAAEAGESASTEAPLDHVPSLGWRSWKPFARASTTADGDSRAKQSSGCS